jgi:hypothetical protein
MRCISVYLVTGDISCSGFCYFANKAEALEYFNDVIDEGGVDDVVGSLQVIKQRIPMKKDAILHLLNGPGGYAANARFPDDEVIASCEYSDA